MFGWLRVRGFSGCHRNTRTGCCNDSDADDLVLKTAGHKGGPKHVPETVFWRSLQPHPCGNCAGDNLLDFEVRMAFQPIVDARTRTVYAYEALVRGSNGEGAGEVIARVQPEQL